MQYRNDPKSGNRISALGLGCMRFPGYELGRPHTRAAEALIAAAVDAGVNYLDTAYLYPGNEACVGSALAKLGLRDRVLLATKLPHNSCKSIDDVDRIFTEQLARLQTDRVDYYLMHNITAPAQWERLVKLGIESWIARQKRAGRIGQIGFSFHGAAGDFPVLLDAYDWDFCQIQYNYANERYQAGTAGLNAAAERGLAVFVMEPLLGGRLAGKLPAKAKRVFSHAEKTGAGALGGADGTVLRTPADWALAWVWNHPQVTMLLSGMGSPEEVAANSAVAADALPGRLTPAQGEVYAQVLDIFNQTNRVPCTGCNYCMPCPQGINIPGCFSSYNASYAHGRFTGLQQYFTASAVRSSEPRLASNCVACGKCTRHCPQQIDIPARMDDVRRRLQPGPVNLALKLMTVRKN